MNSAINKEPQWEGMTTAEAAKLLESHQGKPCCQCFQCLFALSVKSNGWQEAMRLHQGTVERQATA